MKLKSSGNCLVELLKFKNYPHKSRWNGKLHHTGITHIALTVKNVNFYFLKLNKKYKFISENLQEIQLKLSELKENKARNEATIEGIEKRKKDLMYSVKNDLNIDNENLLLSQSDLSATPSNELPEIDNQAEKVEKIKKQRDSLGSVNLRADEETGEATAGVADGGERAIPDRGDAVRAPAPPFRPWRLRRRRRRRWRPTAVRADRTGSPGPARARRPSCIRPPSRPSRRPTARCRACSHCRP